MPCGAAVETNGLKSSVIELSGELSITSVFDFDELLLVFDDPDEPHAPSPIASRPAVATAASPLCVRSFVLMVTFLSPCESIPDSWGAS
jgi:hypothetical protein